jgi:hypothetical protein
MSLVHADAGAEIPARSAPEAHVVNAEAGNDFSEVERIPLLL